MAHAARFSGAAAFMVAVRLAGALRAAAVVSDAADGLGAQPLQLGGQEAAVFDSHAAPSRH